MQCDGPLPPPTSPPRPIGLIVFEFIAEAIRRYSKSKLVSCHFLRDHFPCIYHGHLNRYHLSICEVFPRFDWQVPTKPFDSYCCHFPWSYCVEYSHPPTPFGLVVPWPYDRPHLPQVWLSHRIHCSFLWCPWNAQFLQVSRKSFIQKMVIHKLI